MNYGVGEGAWAFGRDNYKYLDFFPAQHGNICGLPLTNHPQIEPKFTQNSLKP